MDKERFLDVNGFNSEYDIPLEKRLNKYRKRDRSDVASGPVVPVTQRLQAQSDAWRNEVRRRQVIYAFAAAVILALVIAASCYLTFWL